MSSRLNLNDKVEAIFPFSIGGYDFDLKYPTLEEIEPITKLNEEREQAEEANDKEAVAKVDKELETLFYSFIMPAGSKDQPTIQEVLKKQPFPVVKAFNAMVMEQFKS